MELKNEKIILALLVALQANYAHAAWDGTVTGKIKEIHVTNGNNFGFRVVLEGSPKLCGNNSEWAYINESDSNYNTFISVLTAVKAAGQNVRLYTKQKDGDPDGYCQIGYIVVT